MNLRLILLAILCLTLLACSQSEPDPQTQDRPLTLDTPKQRSSYALGLDIGQSIVQGEMELDAQALLTGLRHALENQQALMSEEEQMEALMALQQEFMEAQMAKARQESLQNLELGLEFMDHFREQEGVRETDSGILYRVMSPGDGPKPGPRDVVTVHYTGTTVEGTVFDSSIQRGEPATFPLDQVISGWTEILQLMPQGSTWEVVIPPDLAYGEQQAGPVIGPNSTLVFEIELLETMDPE